MRRRRPKPRARVRRPTGRRNFDLDGDVMFEDREAVVDGCGDAKVTMPEN